MRRKGTTPPDDPIVRLALKQHRVVARAQLLAIGLSRSAIDRLIRNGRLHPVHRGVYAVGVPTLSRLGFLIAAVLACGEGAVLSHRSAAELWGLLRGARRPVDVTVPGNRGRKIDGIRVHRAAVEPAERTEVEGIPVTTPGRTLVDLADEVDRRTLERAVDEAEYLRLDCSGIEPRPGRRGNGRVKAVTGNHAPGSTRTRSELEELFLSLCRSRRLPNPELNAHAEGYEVDALWRSQRLAVELDGAQAHATKRAFESDRIRDAHLTAAGWRVVRLTHARVTKEPSAVGELLARLLTTA